VRGILSVLPAEVAASEADAERLARELPTPGLLEIRYDERTWPGPSPFVDPPVVRWRFEQAAREGDDGEPASRVRP